MNVTVDALLRRRNADQLHQFDAALARRPRIEAHIRAQGIGNLRADAVDRVERAYRLLETIEICVPRSSRISSSDRP